MSRADVLDLSTEDREDALGSPVILRPLQHTSRSTGPDNTYKLRTLDLIWLRRETNYTDRRSS